jgi:hypothetical protein
VREKTFVAEICLLTLLATLSLGGCGGGGGSTENGPTANPYLASTLYALTHFDSAQSDSTPYGPPEGTFSVSPDRQPLVYGGPVNIMTLASTSADYMWGVGTDRIAFIRTKDSAWTEAASLEAPAYAFPTLKYVPEATQRAIGEQSFEGKTSADVDRILTEAYGTNYTYRLMNSSYSVVDRDNVLYANYGKYICAFALVDGTDPSKGIRIARSADIAAIQGVLAPAQARLYGLTMTYDGHLVVNFSNGIAVIDRSLDTKTVQFIAFGADERTSNSVAVDENNGIYVASNKLMHKLVWTGTTLSASETDGAWTSPYDAPTDAVPPIVKFDTGTGSTPTLMGFGSDPDKLVVITDGAKRMKLVAFWRDDIPSDFVQRAGTASRRIAGQIQVTCGFSPLPEWIQSEQSVVVRGYGAFVVNNIPENAASFGLDPDNKLLGVFTMGPVFPTCLGAERFRWDSKSHAWASVWSRPDVSSTSMIPVNSRSSNMALVAGYATRGWEVTGMDWDTGTTVHRTLLGKQNFGNGAYAILEYFPKGDLLFNSAVGPFRVRYEK